VVFVTFSTPSHLSRLAAAAAAYAVFYFFYFVAVDNNPGRHLRDVIARFSASREIQSPPSTAVFAFFARPRRRCDYAQPPPPRRTCVPSFANVTDGTRPIPAFCACHVFPPPPPSTLLRANVSRSHVRSRTWDYPLLRPQWPQWLTTQRTVRWHRIISCRCPSVQRCHRDAVVRRYRLGVRYLARHQLTHCLPNSTGRALFSCLHTSYKTLPRCIVEIISFNTTYHSHRLDKLIKYLLDILAVHRV